MFDLKFDMSNLFGDINTYSEVLSVVNAKCTTVVEKFPAYEAIVDFFGRFKSRDKVEITMEVVHSYSFRSDNPSDWQRNYQSLMDDNDKSDEVIISVYIKKSFDHEEKITIFCFESFLGFYKSKSKSELIEMFSNLFEEHPSLYFEVMDDEVEIITQSIYFLDDNKNMSTGKWNRKNQLSKCRSASTYFNMDRFPLLPQDFHIVSEKYDNGETIVNSFKELETIFSLVYLANNSHLLDNQLLMCLLTGSKDLIFSLGEVTTNTVINELFYWGFDSDSYIERIGIIRNVLADNCNTEDVLQGIGDDIFSSVKSNYMLFQKKIVEQYVEMKKQISTFIVDSTKQMQDIVQGIADALKNNFIAVIMFLITVLITDSVDWEDITSKNILNQDLVIIIKIFVLASAFYLVITLLATVFKWRTLSLGYKDLKKNYSNVLDSNDLEIAFQKDVFLKRSRMRLIICSIIVSIGWITFLILVNSIIN